MISCCIVKTIVWTLAFVKIIVTQNVQVLGAPESSENLHILKFKIPQHRDITSVTITVHDELYKSCTESPFWPQGDAVTVFNEAAEKHKSTERSHGWPICSTPVDRGGRLRQLVLTIIICPVFHPIFILVLFKSIDALERAESSDCSIPYLPVLIEHGGVRICEDYKVTINKRLVDFKYPRIGEILSTLAGDIK
uniref:Uncharacterized protein n=1 Tax=Glossina pallidipes TaxID=7398 RepID=A0A1A9ZVB5_GLOPL